MLGDVPRLVSRAALLGALCLAGVANAAPRTSAAFIRALSSTTRAHPLSDPSGRLPLFVEVPEGVDARALGLLPIGPGLATARVAPDRIGDMEAAGFSFSVWPGLRPVLDRSIHWNRTDAYRASLAASAAVAGTGKGVVVGILDTGIDAAHADFLDAQGKTRVAWLLDLSHPPIGLHPEIEGAYGCTDPNQTPCAVLAADDIDRALAGGTTAGYVPRDQVGHGTHVASIAAGGGGPQGRYVGGAPEASLVIASITHGATGELSDPDIVTGARFVFDRAEAMGMPAVVNLSLGGDFGPHDGSTPIERALSALVGAGSPGRALVLAAGNSGTLWRGPRAEDALGIHTEVRVTRDLPAHVPLLSPGDQGGPLLSGAVYVWVAYRPGDRVSVGLTGPGGVRLAPVPVGQMAEYKDALLEATIDNGVVREDIGLTDGMHSAVVAWGGQWAPAGEVTIDLEGEATVEMWLQGSEDGAPSSYGLGQLFRVATREQTISVPATASELITVGCTSNRTSWTDYAGRARTDEDFGDPDGACYFTAAGPTAAGVRKPEITAPGALVAAAMSADASVAALRDRSIFAATLDVCPDDIGCYTTDASHALLTGSSMSSPQVAGAVALLLERDETLSQVEVRDLLMQGARMPTGYAPLDVQMGVGVLDVVGTMAAYEARTAPVARDVDPKKSWMGLSTSYMRPDPTWSLTGTVALRSSDGEAADGFDALRLGFSVTGPVVVRRALERVGAGLYTFELAGVDGGGQSEAVIDLTYDNGPIGPGAARWGGHRVVPIAPDLWIAHGAPAASGGCRVAPGTPSRGDSLLLLLVAAVLVAVTDRTRASLRIRAARTASDPDRTDPAGRGHPH